MDRLTQVVDSITGTVTRNYDGLDRLTSEMTPQGTVTYGYDAAGRRSTMTVAGQPAVAYTYDNANRLLQMTQGSANVTFSYDAGGRRLSLTLPNGVTTNYAYDSASELTGITYQSSTSTLGDLNYTYDTAGRRSSIGGSFARTGLPQAVSAASYNANNQLTQWGGSPIGYDANGNMTSDTTKTYGWDARNRLASIGGGVTASFQYDPFGRRVTKSVGGSATSYLYDGANAVQELSGSAPTANLLNAALDEVLTRSVATGTSSYLADALGNTVALADNVGAIQSQYNYEPFGQTTVSGAVNTNPVQYTGRENDVTGLYYYRARYYVPQIGRFISEDPLGFESGDANLYSYVRNSPTNLIDPSGLTWQTNWNFFTDWVLGRNPRTRNYGPNDVETQEMENSVGADRLRQFFYNKNCQDVTRYGYGTARAAWDTLLNPSTADWSSTGAQVGAWGPASAINNENGTVTFTIYNKAGTHSFFYHSVPDRSNPTGPMSNIYQTFQWTEPIPTGGRYGGCH